MADGDRLPDALNPLSERFDPAHALLAGAESVQATLPLARDRVAFRRALPVNNIAACATLSAAPFRLLRPAAAHVAVPAQAEPRAERGVKRAGKVQGVLARMQEKAVARCAPLDMLARRMGRRLRVVVRETHAIRGEIEGVLLGFDKHFNLVLGESVVEDVGEVARKAGKIFIRGENVVLVKQA